MLKIKLKITAISIQSESQMVHFVGFLKNSFGYHTGYSPHDVQ